MSVNHFTKKNVLSNVLTSIEWSKKKGTTSKIKSSKTFLLIGKLTFERLVASVY